VFEKVQPRKWPGFTPPRSRIMPPLRGLLLLRRVQLSSGRITQLKIVLGATLNSLATAGLVINLSG
jgi:hypothetical protein